MKDARVLVVDDEEGMHASLRRALQPSVALLQCVFGEEEAFAALGAQEFDVVLCDIRLRSADGLEVQKRIRTEYPDLPVVMITAFAAVDTAVRSLKQGAYDYISKPFSGEEIRSAVRRALESRRLRLEVDTLKEMAREAREEACIGSSPAMRRLYERAATVANSHATVFISGESGSGKEILARYLHACSPRRDAVLVAANSAAIPESLADSHLFGHVRGSFTGAVSDHRGYLEMASGGTLFLDEIGGLKPEIQAKLLRVTEDRKLRRLGSEREIPVDVRIIAAAQRDPESLVREGRLREDLFYRLASIHLHVPPLRERPEDVGALALHFLTRFATDLKKPIAGLRPEALERLLAYPWPGNVRELRNVMEWAAIFVRPGEAVGEPELPEKVRGALARAIFKVTGDELPPLRMVNRLYIQHVLDQCEGNQSQAARILGMAPSTLWRQRQSPMQNERIQEV